MKRLVLMALLAAAPAQADVIFFSEASGEPGIRVTAQVVVTDAAFASGLDVNRLYESYRFPALQANNLDGLLSMTFTLTQDGLAPFRVYTLEDFLETSPSFFIPYMNAIRIVSAPSALPSVQVSLLNFEDFFSFSFNATSASGFFVTDAPSPCFSQPNTTCQFTGTSPLVVVSVPEPGPLAIFGTALLGLALLRQRPHGAISAPATGRRAA